MGLNENIGHDDPRALLERSKELFSKQEIEQALDDMAAEINAHYGDRSIVMVGIMTGAILPMTWLATRLNMPMVMDFVHATRYRGGLHGAELEYRVAPRLDMEGQHVLIVDDIFDEGNTLAAIRGSMIKRKAASVAMAVLVRKLHDRGLPRDYVDFVGLDVPDVYVFGCGMDAYEHWRQLDRIVYMEED